MTFASPRSDPSVRARLALLALSVCSVVLARVVASLLLDDVPHVMDEITYDLQARTFAAGHYAGSRVDPLPVFQQWFVEDRDLRYGIFPPGWPALLALGHLVGAPVWVNPALHGVTVWLVGRLGMRLFGVAAGLSAAVLYALSPQVLLQAASRMSHSFAALLAVVVLGPLIVAAVEERERGAGSLLSRGRLFGVGLALSWLAATRPLCAVCIAGAAAVALFVCAWRGRLGVARSAFLLVGALPPLAALLAYHHALLGTPFEFPQTRFFDTHISPMYGPGLFRYGPGCNALGFGPSHGCEVTGTDPGHTLWEGLLSVRRNLRVLMRLAAGLGIVAAAAGLGLLFRESRRTSALLLLPLLLVVLAYSAYWYPGVCYGARFYHAALPTFMVAAGGGLALLLSRGRWKYLAVVAGLAALGVYGYGMKRARKEIGNDYWGTDARFHRFAERYEGPKAVVLVAFRTDRIPARGMPWTGMPIGVWTNGVRILSALSVNTPFLDGPLVFGRFHPALVEQVAWAFPGYELLVYVAADDPSLDQVIPLEEFIGTLDPPAGGWQMPPPNFEGFVVPR